jgi:predicted dehydrogenase
MGIMRRFDPPYAAAKQKILEGVIGKRSCLKPPAATQNAPAWVRQTREHGGLIVDMGVHDFDLARWLMGSEVTRVYSEGACLAFPELKNVGDIDNTVINLRFANDAIGNIDMSRNAVYGYDIRTEVLGTEGSLWIGYLQQTATLVLTRSGVTHDTVHISWNGLALPTQRKFALSCATLLRVPNPHPPARMPALPQPSGLLPHFHWMNNARS